MHKSVHISAALAALAAVGGSALAQTPPPPPPHQGMFHNLFHRHPATPPMSGHMMPGRPGMMGGHMMPGRPGMMMGGGIIGNKKTHVFHMPGDPGALPAAQNRVYFHTMQQAMAAGYHRAGGGRMPMHGGPMMHGSPMHGMPKYGMNTGVAH